MIIAGGTLNVTTYFMMRKSSDGTAATGLTPANFDLQYTRSGEAAVTKVTAALNTNGTGGDHLDSTVIEVDATNSKGLYRIDWVDAAFAADVPEVFLSVIVATAFTESLRVTIDPPVNVVEWNGADVATPDTAGFPKITIKSGTGVGEIATSSGVVDTVTTLSNKTGFSLAATGLDAVLVTSTYVASVIAGIWDRVLTGATHNINNSAGRRLREASAIILNSGDAQSGGNNSIQLASGAVTINDQFRRAKVIIVGGTGAGQEAIITSSVASTDTCTITPAWLVNPDNTSEYEILPGQAHATVSNGGYDNATVFVDTVNGNSGTEIGVNGTSTNPSDNLLDAFTIATSNNIIKFEVMPGSVITMPSDSSDRRFNGESYSVLLDGADIGGSRFTGAGSVSGTGIDSGDGPPSFFGCGMGSVTLPPSNGFECGFFGTFTLGSAGNYTWGGSATVFDSPFIIDYGSGLNSSKFFIQSWGGGSVEIQNAGAGTGSYEFNMNGWGDLVINANCSATTEVTLHGNIELTDNASGITIVDNANILIDSLGGSVTEEGIADAVWNEARAGHTTAGTFGFFLDAQVSTIGGGSITEEGIADAVWDELRAGHTIAGSFGFYLDSQISVIAVGAGGGGRY